MTKFFKFIILIFFMWACFLQLSFAIRCWECRSDTDPRCGEPFDNSTLAITDCDYLPSLSHLPGIRATMCRTTRQQVHGERRYIRSCGYLGEAGIDGDKPHCFTREGNGISLEYCTCRTDGCNK